MVGDVGQGGQQGDAAGADPEADQRDADRQAGGHERAEGQEQDQQRQADADQLGRAARLADVLRHLAAQLDLVAPVGEVGCGVLELDHAAVVLEVGHRHVVLHGDHRGAAVLADDGRRDLRDVVDRVRKLLPGGVEGAVVEGACVRVDDDPGVSAGEGGELVLQQVVGTLAARAGDDVVVVERAADRAGQAEDHDGGGQPGPDHPPGVAGGEASEAVQDTDMTGSSACGRVVTGSPCARALKSHLQPACTGHARRRTRDGWGGRESRTPGSSPGVRRREVGAVGLSRRCAAAGSRRAGRGPRPRGSGGGRRGCGSR